MEEGGAQAAEGSRGNMRAESSFKIGFRKLVCMIASCQGSYSGTHIYNLYFEVGLRPIFRCPGERQTSKQVLAHAAQGSNSGQIHWVVVPR